MKNIFACTTLFCLTFAPCSASADHPHTIMTHESEKRYFDALSTFLSLPERQRTTETYLAAARSAWALSLPDRAINLFETALKRLTPDDVTTKVRMLLSVGTIQLQEQKLALAESTAKDALSNCDQLPPLRGEARFLLGSVAMAANRYGDAVATLEQAITDLEGARRDEARLYLGRAYLMLGDVSRHTAHLEEIPLDSNWAPDAIRLLALSSFRVGDRKKAGFWAQKGKAEFPDRFVDSWMEYLAFNDLYSGSELVGIDEYLTQISSRYPASDLWVGVIGGEIEKKLTSNWVSSNINRRNGVSTTSVSKGVE